MHQGEHNEQIEKRISKLERFMEAMLEDAPQYVIDYVDGKSKILYELKSKIVVSNPNPNITPNLATDTTDET